MRYPGLLNFIVLPFIPYLRYPLNACIKLQSCVLVSLAARPQKHSQLRPCFHLTRQLRQQVIAETCALLFIALETCALVLHICRILNYIVPIFSCQVMISCQTMLSLGLKRAANHAAAVISMRAYAQYKFQSTKLS